MGVTGESLFEGKWFKLKFWVNCYKQLLFIFCPSVVWKLWRKQNSIIFPSLLNGFYGTFKRFAENRVATAIMLSNCDFSIYWNGTQKTGHTLKKALNLFSCLLCQRFPIVIPPRLQFFPPDTVCILNKICVWRTCFRFSILIHPCKR